VKGIVSGRDPRVKVLGFGEIEGPFSIRVHAVSGTARKKIEAAGGRVEIIAWDRAIAEDGK
jgi:large subunit ribosomal protein L15